MYHDTVITDEDYRAALRNGISVRALNQRVYDSGMSIEEAIAKPPRAGKHWRWLRIAKEHGVSSMLYHSRISSANGMKWSSEKAATTPIASRKRS